MRELTEQERGELIRRRSNFAKFLDERMPVLTSFMEQLELPDPAMVLVEADRFLNPLSEWMRNQVVVPPDRAWILTRIGYFIGEYFVQKYGGCWFVNDIADSRYFARYVVGKFARIANPHAMIDPFYVADVYIREPVGRDLSNVLALAEAELS